MNCDKCFEEFDSQEEYSLHLKGHYGGSSHIPSYYSGADLPDEQKMSWLSKKDVRRLILETHSDV